VRSGLAPGGGVDDATWSALLAAAPLDPAPPVATPALPSP
jgi:hypothetical protein